jgi:transposase
MGGFNRLIKVLPDNAMCAMEATGYYHVRLATHLHGNNISVYVCNPFKIKNHVRSQPNQAKTDKLDARITAEFLEKNISKLRRWEPVTADAIEARPTLTAISLLTRQKVMTANAIESLQQADGSKKAIAALQTTRETIRQQLKELENELVAIIKKAYPEHYANLLTIPGVGKGTASMLLTYTNGMKKFDAGANLASYIGLCPRTYESGISIKGNGAIGKRGIGLLKRNYYLGSWSAIRKDPHYRTLYDRLQSRGKRKNVALIAIAHQMVLDCFTVVKLGKPWVK